MCTAASRPEATPHDVEVIQPFERNGRRHATTTMTVTITNPNISGQRNQLQRHLPGRSGPGPGWCLQVQRGKRSMNASNGFYVHD
jgi:hypothetical protein